MPVLSIRVYNDPAGADRTTGLSDDLVQLQVAPKANEISKNKPEYFTIIKVNPG